MSRPFIAGAGGAKGGAGGRGKYQKQRAKTLKTCHKYTAQARKRPESCNGLTRLQCGWVASGLGKVMRAQPPKMARGTGLWQAKMDA